MLGRQQSLRPKMAQAPPSLLCLPSIVRSKGKCRDSNDLRGLCLMTLGNDLVLHNVRPLPPFTEGRWILCYMHQVLRLSDTGVRPFGLAQKLLKHVGRV